MAVGACLLLGVVGYGGSYALGIRLYHVPVANMAPTIKAGDQVLARLVSDYEEVMSRNEVVVFRLESVRTMSKGRRIGGEGITYAMRVAGFPGDEVRFSHEGLWINNRNI